MAAERAKREAWITEQTRAIKESTVRGLEPEIKVGPGAVCGRGGAAVGGARVFRLVFQGRRGARVQSPGSVATRQTPPPPSPTCSAWWRGTKRNLSGRSSATNQTPSTACRPPRLRRRRR